MNAALQAHEHADWYLDDRRQVGLDFADPAQVATYDARQRATDAAAAALLDELGVQPGQALADLGCGTGVLACQAALKGCHVHAVDISAAMLQATEARARRLGAQGLQVQQAGFLHWQVPADSLDWVTTQYALHHLGDFWKLVALQRIRAALREGGQLLLRDVVFSCPPAELGATVEAWLDWMSSERGYRRADSATHVRDEHSTFDWVMQGLLQRAGFQVLQTTLARGVYATYRAVKA
jgi:putative AdoMet-dependent methyltransferase